MPRTRAFLARVDSAIDWLANRRAIAVCAIGLLSFGGSSAVSLIGGIPEPMVHDEFGYLLAADTFASGRLTNATHPMWMHFESMHIIHEPSYASKFPPAQGLVLALGQRLGGHPIVGVWLGVGLMCASITWMFFAWLPARWALVGGLLVVMRLGIVGYWAQSYWGGAVAAFGGALLFGALRRVMAQPRGRDALLLGVGLVTLANSRPYEGLMASALAGVVLITWAVGSRRPPIQVTFTRVLLPLAAVLVVSGAAMMYYNVRVTGRPFVLPYQVHASTYRVEPIFLWQTPRAEPAYRHKALRDFHAGFEMNLYRNQHPIGRYGFRSVKLDQFRQLWSFLLGPLLTVPLVMLPWLVKDRWMLFAIATCGLVGAGLLFETWVLRHYAAPVTGLVFVIVVAAMHRWHDSAGRLGQVALWALLLSVAVGTATTVAAELRNDAEGSWSTERAQLARRLAGEGGRHLVIVTYGPKHDVQQEWVYNEADIDGAAVVWARTMGLAGNRKLVDYFRDRTVWNLDVNDASSKPVLRPYVPWEGGSSDPP